MSSSRTLTGVEASQESFRRVRQLTRDLVAPLAPEDCVIQSMPDVSPTRWHLAHTTWFFETFLIADGDPGRRPVNPAFEYLFNSYYDQVGTQYPRDRRGLLSRPTVAEVMDYRDEIDRRVLELLERGPDQRQLQVLQLGLHHEQQHQELMLTDIKHVFSCNPLLPAYGEPPGDGDGGGAAPCRWLEGAAGVCEFGHEGQGFCFDNELPRGETLLTPHRIASRLVTCGEYREFVDDGGYQRPDHWLSLGWQHVRQQGWSAPEYWLRRDGDWQVFTLGGPRPLNDDEPVTHVSYFEADAYARWRDARLPTEFEWEAAAGPVDRGGNFVEAGRLHPAPAGDRPQWYGDAWEWTGSSYSPYPGYRAPQGALGEYNGKFMCNQYVLRGGSCVTSGSHIRRTYRNFFPPEARWQFTAIRLAR